MTASASSMGQRAEPSRMFRLALRAYPRSWRDSRGEELLGVLLDVAAGEGRSRPRPIDAADVVARGLGARWALVRNAVPVGVRQRATILATASGFALSVAFFLFGEWGPWVHNGPGYGPPVGPFLTLGPIVYLAWALAFVAALCLPRAAKFCAGLTLALAADLPILAGVSGWTPAPKYLLILLGLLAALALFGPTATDAHSRRELLGLGGALTGIAVITFGLLTGFDADYFYRAQGMGRFPVIGDTTGLLAAGLALAIFMSCTRSRAWGGAIAMNAIPWIIAPSSLVTLADLFGHIWVGLLSSIAALLALGWVLHRSGTRLGLRHSD